MQVRLNVSVKGDLFTPGLLIELKHLVVATACIGVPPIVSSYTNTFQSSGNVSGKTTLHAHFHLEVEFPACPFAAAFKQLEPSCPLSTLALHNKFLHSIAHIVDLSYPRS